MAPDEDEEKRLRSVALQNANTILLARQRAERELAAERERLRITLASIGDAVISTDAEGRVAFLNGVAETLTGWTQAEAAGRPLPDVFRIVNEDTRRPGDNPALRALKEGVVVGLANHSVLVARDGSERLIDDSAAPMRDESGTPVGAVLVFRDVTERRRAEDALRASEARHRFLADLSAATQSLTEPGEVMAVSARLLAEYLGVDRCAYAEVEDESVFVITGDYPRGVPSIVGRWPVPAFGAECTRLMLANEPYVVDDVDADPRIAPDDLPAYRATAIRAVICVPLHKGGKFTAAMAVHQTVPRYWTPAEVALVRMVVGRCWEALERSRVIHTLRESEERYRRAAVEAGRAAEANAKFRAFFEQGMNFAGVLTLDGTVVEANRLCLDACGFTREEVLGRPFWECGWWNRSPDVVDVVRAGCLHAAGGLMFRTETNYFVAGGDERVVDLILAPVTDEAGRVLFVAATGTDITDRRSMEDSLRDADRKKDEFIALLAHELRNPLAPIRNGLEVVRLSHDRRVQSRTLEMMGRQLTHMVRLVDDLLDVSRITRNKLELRRARVRLADVLAGAVETARPQIDGARHELAVELPDESPIIDADLTRLAQVFSNLLSNSAKYTPPGGKIWLTAERRDREVVVMVRDTGLGIPAASLPQIFDMFSQVDRSIEKNTGGLGIGLALVKGLTEMHGGTVTAESAGPGKGSTFTVRLPVAEGRAEMPSPPPVERPPPASGRRVLVVDDNRDGVESMAEMLALLGHEVCTARDGLEAVEAAERLRPDLVLMDIGMPRLNGLDATRRIRAQPGGRGLTIIALTGWGQDGDRERSREAGCDGHLVKPAGLQDLERLLAGLGKHGTEGR